MRFASSLMSTMDDGLNPLSVREFRQAVRSRWVMVVVVLLLLINLVCIGGYLVLEPSAANGRNGGAAVFGLLFNVLMFVTIGFVPCYVGIRLLLEHNDLNTDLLFGTTLSPGAIVRGKYFSAMALTLLLMSACMPFMTMTYLLRGVDLITIFLSLGLLLAVSALATAMGILVGSIPTSWFIRALIGGLVLAGLAGLMSFTSMLVWEMLNFGGRMFNQGWWPWIGVSVMLALEVMLIGLLLNYSVVFLSPRTSNRMFPLRLYITALWLVTGAIVVSATYIIAASSSPPRPLHSELMLLWGFSWIAATLVLLVASLGERDSWTFRVRRTIPRSILLRMLAFLTYSGSAGAFLWSFLLSAATFLVILPWIDWEPTFDYSMDKHFFLDMFITTGFILCYCLTAILLRVTLLRTARPILLPLVALLFGLSVAVVPFIVVFFMDTRMRDPSPMTLMASPLGLTMPNLREDVIALAIPLLSIWTPTAFLLSLPWFFKQWRQFTRHEAGGVAEMETARLSAISVSPIDRTLATAAEAESPLV